MNGNNLKKAIILFTYFLISILICVFCFNILPKYNIDITSKLEPEQSVFQKEVLLSNYATPNKLTMLYFFPDLNQKEMEYESLKNIMLDISQIFPNELSADIYKTNSTDGFIIKDKLGIKTEKTFSVLIDTNGYPLKLYQEPYNKQEMLTEITYASKFTK